MTKATIWTPMPSVVFGALATFAGLMTLFLPETVGRPLPDTILQAEQMNRYVDWTYGPNFYMHIA